MQERNSFVDEYFALSPIERKEQYKLFWKVLPFNAYRDVQKEADYYETDPLTRDNNIVIENPVETVSRRENSEVLFAMSSRMEALLSLAPITPSFRHFILEGYKLCYLLGADEGNILTYAVTPGKDPESSTLLWTIDDEYPEAAGIFDSARSINLERRGYMQLVQTQFFIERIMKISADKMGINLDSEREKLGESEEEKALKRWRREFIERYHDEP